MSDREPPSIASGRAVAGGRARPSGRFRRRIGASFVVMLFVAAACTAGTLVAAKSAIDTVARTGSVVDALSDPSTSFENLLLVGSDSRAGSDPSSPDFGGIGSEGDVTGSRSDTIIVLHRDKQTGAASLLSVPRDLWVTIAGSDRKNRINGAFNRGPDVLVRTVVEALGVPIHHYIEIDFSGFKSLVDAIGGVQMCFMHPTRDTSSGLDVEPGCHLLDGVQALAYARSRHYQEFRDGEWQEDGTADLGRTKRQRGFVDQALRTALTEVTANPFRAGDVMRSGAGSLTVDDELDLVGAAASLRTAVDGGLATYALPVVGDTIDGMSVLRLSDGAEQVLAHFRGEGPPPPPAP